MKEESSKYVLLTGVEGDTGYTAQEDLKFLNGYNRGEEGLFPFLRSEILLFFFFPVLSSLGHRRGCPSSRSQTPLGAHFGRSMSALLCSPRPVTQLDRREHDAPARRVSPGR